MHTFTIIHVVVPLQKLMCIFYSMRKHSAHRVTAGPMDRSNLSSVRCTPLVFVSTCFTDGERLKQKEGNPPSGTLKPKRGGMGGVRDLPKQKTSVLLDGSTVVTSPAYLELEDEIRRCKAKHLQDIYRLKQFERAKAQETKECQEQTHSLKVQLWELRNEAEQLQAQVNEEEEEFAYLTLECREEDQDQDQDQDEQEQVQEQKQDGQDEGTMDQWGAEEIQERRMCYQSDPE